MKSVSRQAVRKRRARNVLPFPNGARFGDYVINGFLGRGGFGDVFSAQNVHSKQLVAVKLQRSDHQSPKLQLERKVLSSLSGAVGFPRLHWFGEAHGHQALVMTHLGSSLKHVHETFGTLDQRDLRVVSDQILDRLEVIHDRYWLHLDVKPANILLPLTVAAQETNIDQGEKNPNSVLEQTILHLIDFGLSRRWLDCNTGEHVPNTPRRGCIGTVRFASLANQRAEALGRRDDLESLVYTLLYLHRGSLPWSHAQGRTKQERFRVMLDMKMQLSAEEICEGVPSLAAFLQVVRSLRQHERPDYALLRSILHDI